MVVVVAEGIVVTSDIRRRHAPGCGRYPLALTVAWLEGPVTNVDDTPQLWVSLQHARDEIAGLVVRQHRQPPAALEPPVVHLPDPLRVPPI